MITTSTSVIIIKKIPSGAITNYTTGMVSLFIKNSNIQKRFDATTVVNATVSSSGLITFSNVPLWADGSYSLYITAESNSDMDVNGVNLVTLATGYIKKITNESTLAL
jgi:hypothetical protein